MAPRSLGLLLVASLVFVQAAYAYSERDLLAEPSLAARSLRRLFHLDGPLAVVERGQGRRLQDWGGGIGTGDMMSMNDAAGAIYNAVDADNFGATYAATQDGYMDADSAVYPNSGEWLGNNFYGGYGGYGY